MTESSVDTLVQKPAKEYTCVRPSYVKAFHCDGTQCDSRCCREWKIDIDAETYRKYCRIEPDADRQSILSRIAYREETGNYVADLPESLRCPFLRADNLCELQKSYGEDYLADICFTYPRVTCKIGEIWEQSLTVTCPLAARLILLPQEPMAFEETTLRITREGQFFAISEENMSFKEALPDIQASGIHILQDRSVTLDQRLFLLGVFCETLDDLAECNAKKEVSTLVDSVLSGKFAACAEHYMAQNRFCLESYVQYMLELFHALYGMPFDAQKRMALTQIYRENEANFQKHLWGKYHFLLENYAVNEFFLRLYPYAFLGSFSYNYRTFVAGYKMVEFSLMTAASAHGGILGIEDILAIIDRMAERLDHNKTGMRTIRENVRETDKTESLRDFQEKMLDTR